MLRHIGLRHLGSMLLVLVMALGCSDSPTSLFDDFDDDGNGGGGGGGDLNQDGAWMWANPTPQGDHVNRMRFASDNVVFGITSGGAVMKSIDAGKSWEIAYKVFEHQVAKWGELNGLHVLDENTVWVAGTDGQVTRTEDGGHTWSSWPVETTQDLEGVYFHDLNNGFAVGTGGGLFRTTDGGKLWTPVNHPGGGTDLNVIIFGSATDGWIGGDDGLLMYTNDGGDTWADESILNTHNIVVCALMDNGLPVFGTSRGAALAMVTPTGGHFKGSGGGTALDVQFKDADNGFILSAENTFTYLQTGIAGTWTKKQLTTPTFQYILTIATNGTDVAGGGSHGVMAYSPDAGVTWEDKTGMANIPDPYRVTFYDVCFGDVNNGVTVGEDGVVMYSTDGGVTWEPGTSGTTERLLDVWLHSSGRGYAVGEGTTALRTLDGGKTWSPMTVPLDASVNRLRGASMWDEMNGIISGDGTSAQETILITEDGGDTWVNKGRTTSPVWVSLGNWTCAGTDIAYVGQREGRVLKTLNKGETWNELETGTNKGVFHLQFVNETHGWGALEAHDFVLTKDGGLNWTRIGSGTLPGNMSQVHFVDENVGLGVGTSGRVYRSDDGGTNWYVLASGFTSQSHVRAIWMSSATDGVIVGTESKILYTRSTGLPPLQ